MSSAGTAAFVASTPDALVVAEAVAREWGTLGIDGCLLARNIDTGEELGFGADRELPIASVVKVPIALAVLDRIAAGELAADRPVAIAPDRLPLGAYGVSAFRHPATIAVGDLVMLMLSVSDNAAADLLLELVGIDAVAASLAAWGSTIRVRHRLGLMFESATGAGEGRWDIALELAIGAGQESGAVSSAIEALDPARANVASARGLVELLAGVWRDEIAAPSARAELRRLMGLQVFTHRLASDLRSDAIRIAGKTGSFLNLRHEIGVIEADTGDRVAIAVLTRSDRRADVAHDIDLAIGAAARDAFEVLRG